jgi:predicted NBD/HSP70 family sugar kinase
MEVKVSGPPNVSVVIDIGGTTIRAARFTDDHIDKHVQCPTPSVHVAPDVPVADLQQRLVEVICDSVHAVLGDLAPGFASVPTAVAISFSGRVDEKGASVLSAPDIWGTWSATFPLAAAVEDRLHQRVAVRLCSDVVAAAVRYGENSIQSHSFALLLSRTGISYVTKDPHVADRPEPVLVGHTPHPSAVDDFRCTCGDRNHVAAFSSGAGALNVIMCAAVRNPKAFRASALFQFAARKNEQLPFEHRVALLERHAVFFNVRPFIEPDVWRDMFDRSAELTPAEIQHWLLPALLDTDMYVRAVEQRDGFALDLLDVIVKPVADHLQHNVFESVDVVAIGGGFARALGEAYRSRLTTADHPTIVQWAGTDALEVLRATKSYLVPAGLAPAEVIELRDAALTTMKSAPAG